MPSKTAKTPTKKTTRKTARKSSVPSSKAAPKRATVASLTLELTALEKRLKAADAKNRKALKSLEAVVDDVRLAAKKGTSKQKAALTRGLNSLEVRVETYLERAASDARAGVKSELTRVTAPGADLSTLEQAVKAAHARLDESDTVQRTSLASLNRHIADLATSVDGRLRSETQARKASSAALEAKIETVQETFEARFDQVEQDTAVALKSVGDKITEFAAVLEGRAKTSDSDTAERLADLAQETQSEFSTVQTDVTARLEALETIASAWKPEDALNSANPYLPANESVNANDPRIDKMSKMIQSLQEELRRVHTRMSDVQKSSNADASVPSGNIVALTPPALTVTASMTPTHTIPAQNAPVQENPYAAAARALEMSAAETATPQMTPPPMQSNSNSVQSNSGQPNSRRTNPLRSKPQQRAHVPQEFDPSAFTAQASQIAMPTPISVPTAQDALPPVMQSAPLAPPPAPPIVPPAPAMASPEPYAPIQIENLESEPFTPAPTPVATYDNPAYAESADMRAERIGGNVSKRANLPKNPISGRNLRVGAVAVGIGVAGLFAAKTIFGGSETGYTQVKNEVPVFASTPNSAQGSVQTINSTPPAGQYAKAESTNAATSAQETLDAAVAAGNPIAQFQKGLVQLQTGQMKEGARLIRLAANRNQPAAQYRLAKLYESGTGIAKDPITARELIQRAATGGNRIAMHDLGNYYAYGQGGVDRDMSQALAWFTKAAERGVVDSQFNVAFLSEGNEGVKADAETALFWYYVAARQGDQGAPDRIAVLTADFEPTTLAEIKSRADRFSPKPVDEAANGVFRNVPWNKQVTQTASGPSSAEILKIRDAQTLLGSLGYEVGTPDGIPGSKTRKAVKSFESVNGLPETGQITDELIQKLEIATGA